MLAEGVQRELGWETPGAHPPSSSLHSPGLGFVGLASGWPLCKAPAAVIPNRHPASDRDRQGRKGRCLFSPRHEVALGWRGRERRARSPARVRSSPRGPRTPAARAKGLGSGQACHSPSSLTPLPLRLQSTSLLPTRITFYYTPLPVSCPPTPKIPRGCTGMDFYKNTRGSYYPEVSEMDTCQRSGFLWVLLSMASKAQFQHRGRFQKACCQGICKKPAFFHQTQEPSSKQHSSPPSLCYHPR